MRELKILVVVLFFTGVVYWGVEPFAHSVMHPAVAPADFDYAAESDRYEQDKIIATQNSFDQIKDSNSNEAKLAHATLEKVKSDALKVNQFWRGVKKISGLKGDPVQGEQTFLAAGCTGCHGLSVKGMPAPMDKASASAAFGVVPPDLSNVGYIYSAEFLAGVIKKPNYALHLEHKFNDTHPFPMTDFFGAGGENMDQEVADIVAYLVSIAPKKMTNKEVFETACQRCHSVKYDGVQAGSDLKPLSKYMASTPPDLSIIVRARSTEYLENFINDPQRELPGTSMPRVGLNKKSEEQVISYLESVGDGKKDQRESLGVKVIIYFIILSIFAVLWKVKIWKRVH